MLDYKTINANQIQTQFKIKQKTISFSVNV